VQKRAKADQYGTGWKCKNGRGQNVRVPGNRKTALKKMQRVRICFVRNAVRVSKTGGLIMGTSSYIAKPHEIEHKWYVIDAEGKTLGRLATEAASILRGKKKPVYTPHVDTGDYVIVINAEKVEVTGKKRKEKIYKRHTGYPGGLREITFEKLQAKNPEEIIRHAIKGMMPEGRLGRQMFKKLKIYAGPEHPHTAQTPVVWEFQGGK
jgi:large subunit ribosomal protein L13